MRDTGRVGALVAVLMTCEPLAAQELLLDSGAGFLRGSQQALQLLDREELGEVETYNAFAVIGYVKGILATHESLVDSRAIRPGFCLPEELDELETVRVVLTRIVPHTELAAVRPPNIVFFVLRETFPCNSQTGQVPRGSSRR